MLINNKYYPLSWFMVTVVILISSIVIFNSIDYLSIMDSYPFIFYIILLQLSMINFILSYNIIVAFFYWDLLGLISYLPINFWSSKVNCGIKAVLYNKIGDNFFLLLLILFYSFLSFIQYYLKLSYSIILSFIHYLFIIFYPFINQLLIDYSLIINYSLSDNYSSTSSTLSIINLSNIKVVQSLFVNYLSINEQLSVNYLSIIDRSLVINYLSVIDYYWLFIDYLLSIDSYLFIIHYSLFILYPLSLFFILYSKSAQLPFSTRSLNAISAPTPISSLSHSSTMVIAGVFRYYY